MSNLHWILLFAGFAILFLLFFTGKPRKVHRRVSERSESSRRGGQSQSCDDRDVALTDSTASDDPLMQGGGAHAAQYSHAEEIEKFDPSDFERPGGGSAPDHLSAPQYADQYAHNDAYAHGQDNLVAAPIATAEAHQASNAVAVAAAPAAEKMASTTTLGGRLDALSARLTGRQKKPAQSGEETDSTVQEKVILLHVVAPEGQLIDGELLLQAFEQRRYHFGELNVFHSLHQGQIVFSVAKMVEPGSFDVNDITSFETPGLVLILQLPGPVAGDVAFEVLVSEAQELADALGCRVLDSKRSTLSWQTTQHLRESVSNYLHRQKYFNKVPS